MLQSINIFLLMISLIIVMIVTHLKFSDLNARVTSLEQGSYECQRALVD